MKAVITVFGKDKTGIIYHVSKILWEQSVNIDDISQTIMQDNFVMVMLVSMDKMKGSFSELKTKLTQMAAGLGLSVEIQKEEIINAMHQI